LDRLFLVKKGLNGATPTHERGYEYDESDNRKFFDDYTVGANGITYYSLEHYPIPLLLKAEP
jgi:hypothetical protein